VTNATTARKGLRSRADAHSVFIDPRTQEARMTSTPVYPWTTIDLPSAPDQLSPSGASEIRLLPEFASGQFAHAQVSRGEVAQPAVLNEITEFYFVLEGRGELWRTDGRAEAVIDLIPGRCASIPPGVSFQYRTDADPVTFIVASVPRWERRFWADSTLRRWPAPEGGSREAAGEDVVWGTCDVADEPTHIAPDGSEIRELLRIPAGGLAHCRLAPGAVSLPIRHRTVEEVWFVISGTGDLWRAGDDAAEKVDLRPRRGVSIPTGIAFQFRATGARPLEILIGTFPEWPGPDEAEPVDQDLADQV
jgi:mannose-6-phosphate isomerase-like protein (cupin superfamily)